MTDTPTKVLIVGSGPIIIGQAAEFDYAGTQACKAMREEGITSILVNSNPATIMTDEDIADVVYIEPLTVPVIERIIAQERPDGLIPTLGGQTGLNLAVALADAGVLEKYRVKLLGTPLSAIQKAEDRELFRQTMTAIGEPIPASRTVTLGAGSRVICRRNRPAGRHPARLYAGRNRRRHRPYAGRAAHDWWPAGSRRARSIRCSWRNTCSAGKRSNTKSCATAPTIASPYATWKTSIPWACTPAIPSSSLPARR